MPASSLCSQAETLWRAYYLAAQGHTIHYNKIVQMAKLNVILHPEYRCLPEAHLILCARRILSSLYQAKKGTGHEYPAP